VEKCPSTDFPETVTIVDSFITSSVFWEVPGRVAVTLLFLSEKGITNWLIWNLNSEPGSTTDEDSTRREKEALSGRSWMVIYMGWPFPRVSGRSVMVTAAADATMRRRKMRRGRVFMGSALFWIPLDW